MEIKELVPQKLKEQFNEIDFEGGKVVGVSGRRMDDGTDYTARGEATIIASGGICGGDAGRVARDPERGFGGGHDHIGCLEHRRRDPHVDGGGDGGFKLAYD